MTDCPPMPPFIRPELVVFYTLVFVIGMYLLGKELKK